MPKGYIIAHMSVNDPETYKEYVEKDTPILQDLGGRFVVRGGSSRTVEGECPDRHVVIEFPSYEAALAAYENPSYQKVADIRRRAATGMVVVVEGAP